MSPVDGVQLHHVAPTGLGKYWYWGEGMGSELASLSKADSNTILHIHGVWSAPQHLAAKIAFQKKLPTIVSAHGMLEPWLWNRQGAAVFVKKKMYWSLIASNIYKRATVLHAITPLEQKHLHELAPKVPIEVIPNAVDIGKYTQLEISLPREKIILFLGRIDPKKGVDILIKAFASALLTKEWRLVIAGPSWSNRYMNLLHNLVSTLGLEDRIDFVGSVFGEKKVDLLKRAWILAVPSYSEVVGLVNLEAALYGLPTITTHQTGLFDWEDGGGLLINPNVEQIKEALEAVACWSDLEHKERAIASLELVKKKYSWDVVEPMWVELYQRISSGL